jgi:hypothetical protein
VAVAGAPADAQGPAAAADAAVADRLQALSVVDNGGGATQAHAQQQQQQLQASSLQQQQQEQQQQRRRRQEQHSQRRRRLEVTASDFEAAMERVGASALRGHQVDVPHTRWEDIGGLHEVMNTDRVSLSCDDAAGACMSAVCWNVCTGVQGARSSRHECG